MTTKAVAAADKERLLARHFLFAGLDADLLRRLAALSETMTLARGDVLFYQGDEGDALYGIFDGSIRICLTSPDGKEYTINLMESGDVFGEIALLDGLPRTADARAGRDSRLLRIPRRAFLDLMEQETRLMRHVVDMLCERIRVAEITLAGWVDRRRDHGGVAFLDLRARLAKRLLDLSLSHGVDEGSGIRIGLTLTQTDVAQMLGVTREAVNKQIQTLVRGGLISMERGTITILARPKLSDIATAGLAER